MRPRQYVRSSEPKNQYSTYVNRVSSTSTVGLIVIYYATIAMRCATYSFPSSYIKYLHVKERTKEITELGGAAGTRTLAFLQRDNATRLRDNTWANSLVDGPSTNHSTKGFAETGSGVETSPGPIPG